MIPLIGILVLAVVAVAFIGYMIACTVSGRYEPVLLLWAILAPLGYSVLAYPHDRPILTLHRLIILPLIPLILLLPPLAVGKFNRKLLWLAIAWGLFVLGAFLSLLNEPKLLWLSASRGIVDAFILPPVLGWITYRGFSVRNHLSWIHLVLSLVSMYLLVIGISETVTGLPLLPQAGASVRLYSAGEGSFTIARPNGPFANPGTFSLVSMINLFLLMFSRRAMSRLPLPVRILHWPAVVAALAVSLLTLTRGVIIAFF